VSSDLEIQRLTTNYLEIEDRFRISGETRDGQFVGLWLTQRLLVRVLPHVFKWLDKSANMLPASSAGSTTQATEMLQGFAQQEAHQALKKQPVQKPVVAKADKDHSLVRTVDLSANQGKLKITFHLADGDKAALRLNSRQLRQWLTILNRYWLAAGWPATIWPQWINGGDTSPENNVEAIH